MNRQVPLIANEKGSVILVGMIVLVMLTLFGMSAITSSNIEVQIAANEAHHKRAFYTAESGWNLAVAWLSDQFPMPTQETVLDLSTPGEVGFAEGSTSDEMPMNPGNSFSTTITFRRAAHASGYSTNFSRFEYDITSTASGPRDTRVQVTVGAGRIELVGL